MSQPIAKGRVCYAAEYYPTQERDAHNKPKMKARYATLGRATMWPSERQGDQPQISIDLDSLPIGSNGAIKMTMFWDNDQQGQQYAPPQDFGYDQGQPNQQSYGQPQSFGSWGNTPQQQPQRQPAQRRQP